MRIALDEANKAVPTPTAFCVGCVITAPAPAPLPSLPAASAASAASASPSTSTAASFSGHHVLATGFSREIQGNTHAEANALDKLAARLAASAGSANATLMRGASLYTTLEPCSVRTSGLQPCAERILASGVSRVFMGVEEPTDFVVCEGVRILREAGVEVVVVVDEAGTLGKKCLAAARRGH